MPFRLLHRRAQCPSNGPNDVGFSAGVWLSCNQIGGETRYVCDHPAAVEPIDWPALPRSEAHLQGIQVHGREPWTGTGSRSTSIPRSRPEPGRQWPLAGGQLAGGTPGARSLVQTELGPCLTACVRGQCRGGYSRLDHYWFGDAVAMATVTSARSKTPVCADSGATLGNWPSFRRFRCNRSVRGKRGGWVL
jgi:hypothetical protein